MAEQITIKELTDWNNRTWLTAAIMNALGNDIDNYGIIAGETTEISVSLIINGKEAELSSFFKHLEKEFDRMLEAEAGNLLRKRIGEDAFKRIDSIKAMVKKCEVELFETYFPDDKQFNDTRWDD